MAGSREAAEPAARGGTATSCRDHCDDARRAAVDRRCADDRRPADRFAAAAPVAWGAARDSNEGIRDTAIATIRTLAQGAWIAASACSPCAVGVWPEPAAYRTSNRRHARTIGEVIGLQREPTTLKQRSQSTGGAGRRSCARNTSRLWPLQGKRKIT